MAEEKKRTGKGSETADRESEAGAARARRLKRIHTFLLRKQMEETPSSSTSSTNAQEEKDEDPRLCIVPEAPAHLALANMTPMSETGTYQLDKIEFDENGHEIERCGPPPLPAPQQKKR